MPSSPSPLLRLELQATGEALNTWGTRLNTVISLAEQAIAGALVKPLTGNTTLTTTNYAADEARNATLIFTAGVGLTASPTVTVPQVAKQWFVQNRTTFPIIMTCGGTDITIPASRQGPVVCDGVNLLLFEPVSEAVAIATAATTESARQAGVSATAAASSAGTATTSRNAAQTARDEARAARDAAQASATNASTSAANAANSATAAANSAAGVNLPAVSSADAGKALVVNPAGTGFIAQAIAQAPIYPIYISQPAAGATATASQTFVAQAYGSDTLGFYSLYGFPQASRTVNVYTTGSPNVIFKTQTANGAGNSITVNLGNLGLSVSTQYLAEMVFTDAVGNTQKTAKSQFVTPAQFRPNIGESYQGGFYTGQISDGGTTYDLIVAPKSGGETTGVWSDNTSTAINTSSRTNGPSNSDRVSQSYSSGVARFCENLALNGYSDWYLPAIDELELAYRNLKPGTVQNSASQGANSNSVPAGAAYTTTTPAQTSVVAFRVGGAEAFSENPYWTSTENDASSARRISFNVGSQLIDNKSVNGPARAFRRVTA